MEAVAVGGLSAHRCDERSSSPWSPKPGWSTTWQGSWQRGHEVVVVPLMPRRSRVISPRPSSRTSSGRQPPARPRTPFAARARLLEGGAMIAEAMVRHRGHPLRFAAGRGRFPLARFGPRLLCATRCTRARPSMCCTPSSDPPAPPRWRCATPAYSTLPIVCSFHGYDANVIAAQYPGCFDGMLGQVARVTAGTEFIRGVVEGLGFDPAEVTVWPQGVDTDHVAPRRRACRGGRLSRAFRRPPRAVQGDRHRAPGGRPRPAVDSRGLRYTVIGEGELRASSRRSRRELGIDDITTFHGPQPHDEVLRTFRGGGCLRAHRPRRRRGPEGGPRRRPLWRRWPVSCRLLASRAGGLTEVVIDGETGLMVEPEDVAAAADALIAWPATRRCGRAHGRRGPGPRAAFVLADHSLDVIEQVSPGERGVTRPAMFFSWSVRHGRSRDLAAAFGAEPVYIGQSRRRRRRWLSPARFASHGRDRADSGPTRRPSAIFVMTPPVPSAILALTYGRISRGCPSRSTPTPARVRAMRTGRQRRCCGSAARVATRPS